MSDRFEKAWKSLIAWIDSEDRRPTDLVMVRDVRAAATEAISDANRADEGTPIQ